MSRYLGLILIMGLILVACGRSPDSQFYILNPLPPQKEIRNYHHLRIGIGEINSPSYTFKPQFIFHCSAHQVKLEEFHRWAEGLDKNIRRVIETNLLTLLPGATIASSPWDTKFKPNYQLNIAISQFEVDCEGNSLLRAEYLIYSEKQLIKKGTFYYHLKIQPTNVTSLVASMNTNLNHLTQDIAKVFSSEMSTASRRRVILHDHNSQK